MTDDNRAGSTGTGREGDVGLEQTGITCSQTCKNSNYPFQVKAKTKEMLKNQKKKKEKIRAITIFSQSRMNRRNN